MENMVTKEILYEMLKRHNNHIKDISLENVVDKMKSKCTLGTLIELEKEPSQELYDELNEYDNITYSSKVIKLGKIYKKNCIFVNDVNFGERK